MTDANKPPRPAAPAERTAATGQAPARLNSRELLGPQGEVIIEHDGREYRLRFTQNGKLILTA